MMRDKMISIYDLQYGTRQNKSIHSQNMMQATMLLIYMTENCIKIMYVLLTISRVF